MSANERQVGGDHYKGAAMEHWDYVIESGIGYLRGCASKYVYRWRDKGGLADLKKCGHYIEKILDISETENREKFRYGQAKAAEVTAKFIAANGIGSREATVLSFLATDYDVGLADEALRTLISEAEESGFTTEDYSNGNKLQTVTAELEKTKADLDEQMQLMAKLNADAATASDKMNEMAAALTAAQAEVATLKTDKVTGDGSGDKLPDADNAMKTSDPAPADGAAAPQAKAGKKRS